MIKNSYSLAPYCEILDLNGHLHVGFGSVGLIYSDTKDIDFVFSLLTHVELPTREISEAFWDKTFSPHETAIVENLKANNLIAPTENVPSYNRNHRDQLYYLMQGLKPKQVAEQLSEKTVCVIGCGGIGCIVSLVLATQGIGRLILMDDDKVEIHNVSRQFAYTEQDVGKYKVPLLEAELRKRSQHVEIRSIVERATFDPESSNIPEADFYVLAADQRGIIPVANRYFVSKNKPYLHTCYINDIAVWGPLVNVPETGCWGCKTNTGSDTLDGDKERTQLLKKLNSTYTCPIISPVSLMATSFAALDIIKFLTDAAPPISLNRRVGVWTGTMNVEYQDFSKNPNCTVCG